MPKTIKKLDYKEILKYFLQVFIPVSLLILAYTLLSYKSELDSEKALFIDNQEKTTNRVTQMIVFDLEMIIADLLVISEKNELKKYIGYKKESDRRELENEYLIDAKRKGYYDEISLIDENGNEKIKVRYDNGKPKIASVKEMKNRDNESVYKDLMNLGENDIYLSRMKFYNDKTDFDNPQKPFFHIGRLLFDTKGSKKGALIINYYTSRLIQNFEQINPEKSSSIMYLVNSDGFWIENTEQVSEFNTKLAHAGKFSNLFPNEWKHILGSDNGYIISNNGFFTYSTVYPNIVSQRFGIDSFGENADIKGVSTGTGFFWKIISISKPNIFNKSTGRVFRIVIFLDLILLLILGITSYYLAIYRSIKKKAEEALKESEARYSTLVEQANEGVFIIIDDKIIFSNSAFSNILGVSSDKIAGMSFLEFVLPDFKDCVNSIINKFNSNNKAGSINEVILKNSDGSFRIVDISFKTINLKSREHIMGILHDITERKKAEEKIARLRDDFISTLVHDMKSPLTSILGYLRLISDPLYGAISDRKIEFVEMIHHSGEVMLSMINNLTNASRIEAGLMTYNFEVFSIKALLNELNMTFASNSTLSGIELCFKCQEEIWIYADRERIRGVFYNLISNAFRYVNQGGQIKISVIPNGDLAEISVSDNGRGIPKAEQDSLFEKYKQIKGERYGTGLGLYIVKNILEGHGTTIKLESEQDKGTSFNFSLKMVVPPLSCDPAHKNIFLLSRQDSLINVITESLKSEKYFFHTFPNGKEAIKKIESFKPDLIILYDNLPDISAEEFNASIRKKASPENIPLVIITRFHMNFENDKFTSVIPLPLNTIILREEAKRFLE